MRSAILISLLVGSSAASAGNVGSGVGANVANLCVFQSNGVDINSLPPNNSVTGTPIALGQYKANATSSKTETVAMIQCNKGTTPTTSFQPDPIDLNRVGGGGDPLKVLLLYGMTRISQSNGPTVPDVFRLRATAEAEAGQWGVRTGDYQGTATVTVTYN